MGTENENKQDEEIVEDELLDEKDDQTEEKEDETDVEDGDESGETKKFSQKDVNKILQKRLVKYKEYETIVKTAVIEPALKEIEEPYKSLVSKMPLKDQVEFIKNLQSKKTDKKFMPKTPQNTVEKDEIRPPKKKVYTGF